MYLLTQSGLKFDYANPSVEMVNRVDIALALSHTNRFAGHTPYPFSVAQHSVAVMLYLRKRGASTKVQLAGLMHDAHEAYFGDVPTPLKKHLNIKEAENALQAVVLAAFGLTLADVTDPAIKTADHVALCKERDALISPLLNEDQDWCGDLSWVTAEMLADMPDPQQMDPRYVARMFLNHLTKLQAALSA